MFNSTLAAENIEGLRAVIEKYSRDHPLVLGGQQLFLSACLEFRGFQPTEEPQIEIYDATKYAEEWEEAVRAMPDATTRSLMEAFRRNENIPVPVKTFARTHPHPFDTAYRIQPILRRLHKGWKIRTDEAKGTLTLIAP